MPVFVASAARGWGRCGSSCGTRPSGPAGGTGATGRCSTPLSESWPPEVTRRLQEPREKAPSTPVPPPSGDAASLWRDAGVDAQPQHVSKEGIGSSSAASKGPCGAANIWRELPAMDGRALYYNIVTNATTFEPPALMGSASGERKGEENKGFAAIEGK
ncbi:hypothetical protein TcBrA4_0069360 [Trypanosoma cruzi]|nr:hypothetical protein TcBrA4_0069360 [Trypanosoma cruzi]